MFHQFVFTRAWRRLVLSKRWRCILNLDSKSSNQTKPWPNTEGQAPRCYLVNSSSKIATQGRSKSNDVATVRRFPADRWSSICPKLTQRWPNAQPMLVESPVIFIDAPVLARIRRLTVDCATKGLEQLALSSTNTISKRYAKSVLTQPDIVCAR